MLPAGRGAIVNVSSILGLAGAPGRAAYCSAKAGLIGLTRALAAEWARRGVRVNAVCPGYVDTPWQHNALGDTGAAKAAERYSAMAPLKDYARPGDVADAIVWLIEGARQVTGETIFVDGGMHISTPR
jgi:NAD(P)-dependent dehydrogenase (short-subunit alcohol dehydrogenase family)